MKKTILIMSLLSLIFVLSGCNSLTEYNAKRIVKSYYNALMDENYQQAFEKLYLYDFVEEHHPIDGTILSQDEAEAFFMKKIDYLNQQNYRIKNFEIDRFRYEDGHTFFLEVSVQVEQDGQSHKYSDTIDVWEGRVWIVNSEDPFVIYRDGKMNFDMGEEGEDY